jgi:hypothetical protein
LNDSRNGASTKPDDDKKSLLVMSDDGKAICSEKESLFQNE